MDEWIDGWMDAVVLRIVYFEQLMNKQATYGTSILTFLAHPHFITIPHLFEIFV